MTKRELVVRISNETGLSQHDVFGVLQRTLDYMLDAVVKGETIEFRDFGVFETKVRRPRVGRNPHKPEVDVSIPARRIVKFRAGKKMKALLLQTPAA
jgi:nucleoid DNA-binding protein